MSSQEQNSIDSKYKKIPIILSIIIIGLTCFNIMLNYPTPRLEVGEFPYDSYLAVASKGVIVSDQSNGTIQTANVTNEEFQSYYMYNLTYQVYNSGKGSAYNVDINLKGEPTESHKVISTLVFVGEPIISNLLDTTINNYRIGLLGAGKSYTFLFSLKILTSKFEEGKFILTVSSENAGTIIKEIHCES